MGSAFLLMLREGVEGALVVAILLAYLRRIDRRRDFRWVWAGTLSAVGISLLTDVAAFMLLGGLEGRAEEIMEGTVALVAAGVLTWMIFWMARQARLIRSRLEEKVDAALEAGSLFGLAGIAFVAVLREGIESALFLISTSVGSDSSAPRVLGGLAGVSADRHLLSRVSRESKGKPPCLLPNHWDPNHPLRRGAPRQRHPRVSGSCADWDNQRPPLGRSGHRYPGSPHQFDRGTAPGSVRMVTLAFL